MKYNLKIGLLRVVVNQSFRQKIQKEFCSSNQYCNLNLEKNKEPARKKTVSTQFGLVVQIKWRVEIEYVSVLFMLVKPFVKFALRRFLLRWQPTERSDKGVGRCLSWRSRRARFYSFAVHLSRSQTTQLADCDCCSTYLKKIGLTYSNSEKVLCYISLTYYQKYSIQYSQIF